MTDLTQSKARDSRIKAMLLYGAIPPKTWPRFGGVFLRWPIFKSWVAYFGQHLIPGYWPISMPIGLV